MSREAIVDQEGTLEFSSLSKESRLGELDSVYLDSYRFVYDCL